MEWYRHYRIVPTWSYVIITEHCYHYYFYIVAIYGGDVGSNRPGYYSWFVSSLYQFAFKARALDCESIKVETKCKQWLRWWDIIALYGCNFSPLMILICCSSKTCSYYDVIRQLLIISFRKEKERKLCKCYMDKYTRVQNVYVSEEKETKKIRETHRVSH